MKKVIPLLILGVLLTSCRSLFMQKMLFGVRNPKVYTCSNLSKFINKNEIAKSDTLYALTPESFDLRLTSGKKSNPFVQWNLYDKNGFLVKADSASAACYGNLNLFLSSLDDTTVYLIDSTDNIKNKPYLNKGLTFYNNDSITKTINTKNYDFTLILYWSKFMGSHSKSTLKLEKSFLSNISGLKLKVLKINMDFSNLIKTTNYNGKLPKFKKKDGKIGLVER